MTLLRPSTVGGRYRLEELLGRGGMAEVYSARDEVLERTVAVKLLRNPADPAHRARFVSEADTLAALHHPNIVTLLDAGLDDEFPYLVMDRVAGLTLSEHAAAGPLDSAAARRIGGQVAAALAHAHAAGVVHRDVKPSNIMVDTEGTAFLTDFGIARLLGSVDRHTRADELVGSPAFLAPEQVEAGELTAAADVYSLGLVLLEVLTGQRAYPGSPVEAAIARLRVAPLIPTSLGPDLCRLLEQMTRLAPQDRPTAAEVARALQGRSSALAPSAERTTALTVVPLQQDNPAPPRSRGRRAAAIGVAAATAAVALLVPTVLALGSGGTRAEAPTTSSERSTSTAARTASTAPAPAAKTRTVAATTTRSVGSAKPTVRRHARPGHVKKAHHPRRAAH